MTDTGNTVSTRRYCNKVRMQEAIRLFANKEAYQKGIRFIHILPDITKVDSKIINKQLMPKITPEQLDYIKSQRGITPARDVAKHLKLPVSTVYYYNEKIQPAKEIIVKPAKDDKRPMVRPPSIYSNPRLYETLLEKTLLEEPFK